MDVQVIREQTLGRKNMSRSILTVVVVVVAAAVVIFSVVAGVGGLISSSQKAQAEAIAGIDGAREKGGAQ